VILISGDIHFAQFYHLNCYSILGYNLSEMTTSGLTHNAKALLKVSDVLMDAVTPHFWNVR
jgi:hypothetical protein